MVDDDLMQQMNSFVEATKRVLTPKRSLFSWLRGRRGLDSYETMVRLESHDKVEYVTLSPDDPEEVASAALFSFFGEELAREKEMPEYVTVARLVMKGERETLMIEICDRGGRWVRAFLPLLRDKSGCFRADEDPSYENETETTSSLCWNASFEVMNAFLKKR